MVVLSYGKNLRRPAPCGCGVQMTSVLSSSSLDTFAIFCGITGVGKVLIIKRGYSLVLSHKQRDRKNRDEHARACLQ